MFIIMNSPRMIIVPPKKKDQKVSEQKKTRKVRNIYQVGKIVCRRFCPLGSY